MAIRVKSATWVNGVTDYAVARVVGDISLTRGRQYARDGAVLTLVEGAQGDLLLATVQGSGAQAYQTIVERIDGSDGSPPDWAGRCSCPMRVDCKHTAAVLLTARDAFSLTEAPLPPPWEQVLAPLATTAAQPGDLPRVALEVSLSTRPGRSSERRIDLRPMREGKSKPWVKQGANWSDFGTTSAWRPAQVRPDQHAVITELIGLHRAHTPAFYGFGTPDVHLGAFGASVWPLLRRCAQAGIRLITRGPELTDVRLVDDPAQVVLDVTRTAEGGLSARPALRLAEHRGGGDILLLGSPAHGVGLLDAQGTLTLAPLSVPPPTELAPLLTGGNEIAIPAADAPRFLALYYPVLARRMPVESSDHSVALPTDVAPVLTLDATYHSGHRVRLSWGFAYRLPKEYDDAPREHDDEESLVRVGLHPGEHDPPRDLEHERRLLDSLTELAAIPRMTHRSASGVVQPYPQGGLFGMDTVTFSTEVMPALQARDDVIVRVEGEPPTYQEADEAPVVHLETVDDGAQPDGDWFDLHVSVTVDGQDVPFEPLFSAMSLGEEVMLLDSGTYFSLDRPELTSLRTLIDEARELTDVRRDTLRVSRYQVGWWEELVSLGVVDRQSNRWGAAVDALLGMGDREPAPVPESLRAALRPYQVQGYDWLCTLWDARLGGVLADDMGLGKTVQTLAMAARARERGDLADPLLVVAPASVVGTWSDEAARFVPDLKVVVIGATQRRRGLSLAEAVADADIVVTSYTLLRLEDTDYQALSWSGLVLDEAQFVKNHRSRTYQAARRLGAPFTLAITGTPLENSLMDLWSMLSLAAPGLFPRPEVFTERYRKPIESGASPEQLAVLRQRLRPFMLRRTKDQVAPELPAKQEQTLHIELSPAHRRIYGQHLQRERQRVLGLLDDMDRNRVAIFRALTLLRQMSLDPGLVDPVYAGTGPSAKVEALMEQLQELAAEGHRALVFSSFTGFLKLVRERLDAAGIGYSYLDGRTRDRPARIAGFRDGNDPVFLISLKAGGFGLTLTEADYVFILDPWWNPAAEAQAVDRTHRIGQTRSVMVYRMVSQDTIEDKVVALQARKRDLFNQVIDEGKFTGAAISADDIRGVLEV